jgi:hypothetical protein
MQYEQITSVGSEYTGGHWRDMKESEGKEGGDEREGGEGRGKGREKRGK